MGMSTHAVGIKPPDERWREMKAVYDACRAAQIDVPFNVMAFFGHEEPDPRGVRVRIENAECCKRWSGDSRDGFEIDVSKLPPDVKVVRVYNSY